MKTFVLSLLAIVFLASSETLSESKEDNLRWYKGNLHTHTLWSDGDDFPEMVADWYESHGYHFLALSDHNVLSIGDRWMNIKDIDKRSGAKAFQKYTDRFGSQWVETRGDRDAGTFEVRLKPLDAIRPLVERSGQFLMIPSEEITEKGVHINATNIGEAIPPQSGKSIVETIQNTLKAIDEQSKRLGRDIIPHLNHPNLGDKGISAEELAALVQDEFFEVFNGVEGDGDLGSARRHSLEMLWDITSTLRLSEFGAPPLFGLATDDSHNYHGQQKASPGRGWIMLRAKELTTEAIIAAMRRGDFYSSTGVTLHDVQFDKLKKVYTINIEPKDGVEYTTTFIGSRRNFDKTSQPRIDPESGKPIERTRDYSKDVGMAFLQTKGNVAQYRLTGDELYVRAVVTSSEKTSNPTTESMLQKAWTQPVGWDLESIDAKHK
jgi:hypothetical protein